MCSPFIKPPPAYTDHLTRSAAKPDPVVYLAACDRFDLRPAHVLHVGDLPDVDVTAAQAAGLHAVLIDCGNQHKQAGSLRSLAALPPFLAALNR